MEAGVEVELSNVDGENKSSFVWLVMGRKKKKKKKKKWQQQDSIPKRSLLQSIFEEFDNATPCPSRLRTT